jgi:hypothetical protein
MLLTILTWQNAPQAVGWGAYGASMARVVINLCTGFKGARRAPGGWPRPATPTERHDDQRQARAGELSKATEEPGRVPSRKGEAFRLPLGIWAPSRTATPPAAPAMLVAAPYRSVGTWPPLASCPPGGRSGGRRGQATTTAASTAVPRMPQASSGRSSSGSRRIAGRGCMRLAWSGRSSEQKIRHNHKRIVEKLREWIGDRRPVQLKSRPPSRRLIPGKQ